MTLHLSLVGTQIKGCRGDHFSIASHNTPIMGENCRKCHYIVLPFLPLFLRHFSPTPCLFLTLILLHVRPPIPCHISVLFIKNPSSYYLHTSYSHPPTTPSCSLCKSRRYCMLVVCLWPKGCLHTSVCLTLQLASLGAMCIMSTYFFRAGKGKGRRVEVSGVDVMMWKRMKYEKKNSD